MEFNIRNILNKFKPTVLPSGKEHPIDPYRDWLIICVGASIALLIALSFGIYLFIEINSGDIFLSNNNKSERGIESLNRTELNDVINQFSHKEAEFNELKTKKPTI